MKVGRKRRLRRWNTGGTDKGETEKKDGEEITGGGRGQITEEEMETRVDGRVWKEK